LSKEPRQNDYIECSGKPKWYVWGQLVQTHNGFGVNMDLVIEATEAIGNWKWSWDGWWKFVLN
jgi:hypothetical protein